MVAGSKLYVPFGRYNIPVHVARSPGEQRVPLGCITAQPHHVLRRKPGNDFALYSKTAIHRPCDSIRGSRIRKETRRARFSECVLDASAYAAAGLPVGAEAD